MSEQRSGQSAEGQNKRLNEAMDFVRKALKQTSKTLPDDGTIRSAAVKVLAALPPPPTGE